MEKFANDGGMLPEQVWDADDLPAAKMKRGGPRARPCRSAGRTPNTSRWCAAATTECALIVPSRFISVTPKARTGSQFEMWTFAHRPQRIAKGKTLRIITERRRKFIGVLTDGRPRTIWKRVIAALVCIGQICQPTNCLMGTSVVFTFNWVEVNRWEGRDFFVVIDGKEENLNRPLAFDSHSVA